MKWSEDQFTGKIFGKYQVLCRLAVGGMAEIFLGFGRQGPFARRPVVLKRLLPEQREEPQALQLLVDEAKLTATLAHPNVAQLLDLEVDGEEVLLVIEFIPGANCEELVESATLHGEALPLGFVLAVVRDAAQGLSHAHLHQDSSGKAAPVVHRDVTPRNLMVDFEGSAKMLDFGIARAMGGPCRTVVGLVRGTAAYMSPEQALGKPLDPRSDLFSLGIIFHELLTAQRLFSRPAPTEEMAAVYEGEIPRPSKVNRRVPKALDSIVLRALERTPDRRYQSAAELISDVSLAAPSLVWPKERCAELVRERFAERREDLSLLLQKIPGKARTTHPSRLLDPLPRALKPQSQVLSELSEEEALEPTRLVASRRPIVVGRTPRRSKERLQPQRQGPGDPSRAEVRSGVRVALAAVAALLVGALGGALVHRKLGVAKAPAYGRVSISSDRPASVIFSGQTLGKTPLASLVLPVGSLSVELKDESGARFALALEVVSAQPTAVDVRLDTLKKLP